MNKRGNILIDLVLIPIVLFFMIVSLFLGYWIYEEIKAETTLFNGPDDGGTTAQGEIRNSIDVTTSMFPYIFIMMVVSVLILLVLSAYLIESSIVFIAIGFIILLVAIIISVPISNFYGEFIANATFTSTSNAFFLANTIMNNLPYFVFFMGAIFIILLYGKKSRTSLVGGGQYY